MQLESLEGRTLFYAPVDTSRVFLGDINDNPVTPNRHMALCILAHGNSMDGTDMIDSAHAAAAQLPAGQWQVIIIDWGDLAINDPTHHGSGNASVNAMAVGDKVAAILKAARVPASRVNLVGDSMGGTIVGRIAKDLKTSTAEVNSIIGVDPAVGRLEPANYAQNSRYSLSFSGNDAVAKLTGPLASDDAVLLTGLPGDDMQQHQGVFAVVTTMWERNAGMIDKGNDHVSSIFSLPALFNGSALPWRHDTVDGVFEATIPVGTQPNSSDLGPLSITYVNSRRHRITVN